MYVSVIAGSAPVNPDGKEVGVFFPVCAETPRKALDLFFQQRQPVKAPESPGDQSAAAVAAQAVARAYARGGV